ncbi:alkaline phosphatase [Flavobacteriales bacterium]|nr:alkaline phosphatase [Flavobacteriales bacterium]
MALYIITVIIICSCNSNKPKIINLLTTNKHNVESQTPKNVILMIGDGMGLGQITAAMYANNDFLNIQEFQNIGLIKTNSSSSIITDSAAGATAFSTGKKTYNGAINMDENKYPLIPITSTLKKHKYKTGIITTSSVTHATPACFYGNQIKRYGVDEELALQFTETDIDLLMGGGESFFKNRKDGQDLTEILKSKNYLIIDSIADEIPNETEKLINFCAPKEPVSILEGRGNYLPIATKKGISILNTNNQKGFFLMIEGAQIDWGGHDNDSDYIISETLDFDKSIEIALKFAKENKNTLLLITADHETGGYGVTGENKKSNELNTGFLSDDHTATMVPVFSFGPGSENFTGIYHNNQLYHKILKALNIQGPSS